MHLPFTWRNFTRSPWRVLSAWIIVDESVFGFVCDITHNVWIVWYYGMRWWVMMFDRWIDVPAVVVFVGYHIDSLPHWEVCLGVYIAFRLVSITVCCGTNLCECYFVRSMLLWAASGFCLAALLAPWIAEESAYGWRVIIPVCLLVALRASNLLWFI